ncbi:MAG: amidohydrolase family protein, partial [Burkholderiales bacterium]
MRLNMLAGLLLVGSAPPSMGASAAPGDGPVIDMHVHAMSRTLLAPISACSGEQPVGYPAVDPAHPMTSEALEICSRPLQSATAPAELRDRTLAALRAHKVRRAVVIANLDALADWVARAPEMVIPASIPGGGDGPPDLTTLTRAQAAGKVAIFAELGTQYIGRSADDPQFEPFWALAERLDVPVGIHLGDGMPRGRSDLRDRYRAALTSPFQLEAVLIRHPKLRIYVMHAASPLIDEMIAMLFRYPSLYVDIAANDWSMPRVRFFGELKRLVDAGFGERILFGSDQTLFPQAIGLAIATINDAPFLTRLQKRDIL